MINCIFCDIITGIDKNATILFEVILRPPVFYGIFKLNLSYKNAFF